MRDFYDKYFFTKFKLHVQSDFCNKEQVIFLKSNEGYLQQVKFVFMPQMTLATWFF